MVVVAALGLSGCLQDGVVARAGVTVGYGPGLWRTLGAPANHCEFTRLRSLTGDGVQDTITHDLTFGGPRYIQIDASDAAFYSRGCFAWWRQVPPGPYARPLATPGNTIPGSGDYLVGPEVAPGTYSSSPDPNIRVLGVPQPPICRWKRVSGFHGSAIPDVYHDTILEGGSDHAEVVTIEPGDFGFSTTGCLPWTKVG
jgi:hypothetical protein